MSTVYVVKNEDTLQRIAAKVYGDWTLWKLISDFNKVSKIYSGMLLSIPEPMINDKIHIIQVYDSYESLSRLYYNTEHFSSYIAFYNDYILLSEHVDEEITIPYLLNKKVYDCQKMDSRNDNVCYDSKTLYR
ncbi:MAG: LysM peptidoglycan-binding domain-containing protein [Leptospiraceae bacterium]|nr:LysM peptidoglycan-binding domain-containing protein [Leptospiraceae bacterium]MCP5502617.1 LysM peptidoglycan-binding domain-containing protein [Leptospiraceae bacterium]